MKVEVIKKIQCPLCEIEIGEVLTTDMVSDKLKIPWNELGPARTEYFRPILVEVISSPNEKGHKLYVLKFDKGIRNIMSVETYDSINEDALTKLINEFILSKTKT